MPRLVVLPELLVTEVVRLEVLVLGADVVVVVIPPEPIEMVVLFPPPVVVKFSEPLPWPLLVEVVGAVVVEAAATGALALVVVDPPELPLPLPLPPAFEVVELPFLVGAVVVEAAATGALALVVVDPPELPLPLPLPPAFEVVELPLLVEVDGDVAVEVDGDAVVEAAATGALVLVVVEAVATGALALVVVDPLEVEVVGAVVVEAASSGALALVVVDPPEVEPLVPEVLPLVVAVRSEVVAVEPLVPDEPERVDVAALLSEVEPEVVATLVSVPALVRVLVDLVDVSVAASEVVDPVEPEISPLVRVESECSGSDSAATRTTVVAFSLLVSDVLPDRLSLDDAEDLPEELSLTEVATLPEELSLTALLLATRVAWLVDSLVSDAEAVRLAELSLWLALLLPELWLAESSLASAVAVAAPASLLVPDSPVERVSVDLAALLPEGVSLLATALEEVLAGFCSALDLPLDSFAPVLFSPFPRAAAGGVGAVERSTEEVRPSRCSAFTSPAATVATSPGRTRWLAPRSSVETCTAPSITWTEAPVALTVTEKVVPLTTAAR